ncbi:hypothetical protein ADUPG1_008490 [Aduncisulcus paluster]|uniref:Uncharacterized protein n=2 Tax=Aduncisulcus paluster TaxID=2918883 RepID=A0ABQ5KS61_9EUKA|nr:hypothetical protein ADUPG1_008490 [Aduncisulcus paluster]
MGHSRLKKWRKDLEEEYKTIIKSHSTSIIPDVIESFQNSKYGSIEIHLTNPDNHITLSKIKALSQFICDHIVDISKVELKRQKISSDLLQILLISVSSIPEGLNYSPVQSLILDHCDMDHRCGEIISQMLEAESCNLASLFLPGNPRLTSGAISILNALPPSLTSLDLSDCGLSSSVWVVLGELLQINTNLLELKLDRNNLSILTQKGKEMSYFLVFAQSLTSPFCSLEKLSLKQCHISGRCGIILREAFLLAKKGEMDRETRRRNRHEESLKKSDEKPSLHLTRLQDGPEQISDTGDMMSGSFEYEEHDLVDITPDESKSEDDKEDNEDGGAFDREKLDDIPRHFPRGCSLKDLDVSFNNFSHHLKKDIENIVMKGEQIDPLYYEKLKKKAKQDARQRKDSSPVSLTELRSTRWSYGVKSSGSGNTSGFAPSSSHSPKIRTPKRRTPRSSKFGKHPPASPHPLPLPSPPIHLGSSSSKPAKSPLQTSLVRRSPKAPKHHHALITEKAERAEKAERGERAERGEKKVDKVGVDSNSTFPTLCKKYKDLIFAASSESNPLARTILQGIRDFKSMQVVQTDNERLKKEQERTLEEFERIKKENETLYLQVAELQKRCSKISDTTDSGRKEDVPKIDHIEKEDDDDEGGWREEAELSAKKISEQAKEISNLKKSLAHTSKIVKNMKLEAERNNKINSFLKNRLSEEMSNFQSEKDSLRDEIDKLKRKCRYAAEEEEEEREEEEEEEEEGGWDDILGEDGEDQDAIRTLYVDSREGERGEREEEEEEEEEEEDRGEEEEEELIDEIEMGGEGIVEDEFDSTPLKRCISDQSIPFHSSNLTLDELAETDLTIKDIHN